MDVTFLSNSLAQPFPRRVSGCCRCERWSFCNHEDVPASRLRLRLCLVGDDDDEGVRIISFDQNSTPSMTEASVNCVTSGASAFPASCHVD